MKNSILKKKYQVAFTSVSIKISGKGNDKAWSNAVNLSDFSYPWRAGTPPKTTFKALHDKNNFYFLFQAVDPNILTKEAGIRQRLGKHSDRVEIFFKADDQMNPYYALELDAIGRIMDNKARYHRKIDYSWTYPSNQLFVKTSTNKNGYFVEGQISFDSLRQLKMYKDDGILRVGLFRAEYEKLNNNEVYPKWISWVKPDSSTPDFHIPSSFGILELIS